MKDLVHTTTYQGYDIVHAAEPIPFFTLVDGDIEHSFVNLRAAMNWCDAKFKAKRTDKR
jgi:hypothetical protein